MNKKYLALSLGVLFGIPFLGLAQAAEETTVQTTTTVPSVTSVPAKQQSQAPKVTTPKYYSRRSSTPLVTTTTTTISSPTPTPRKIYDEDLLKDISNTLCTDGYRAYVGNENKNVCQGKAESPDIAYTCVWKKKGPQVYPASMAGPCNLDYTDHMGEYAITREYYKRSPPLPYGSEVQCCFRAAAGK